METLRQRLEELHAELARTESVDASAREALQAVLGDIQALLARSEGEESQSPSSLSERLSEATRHFEESHPTLATTMGRVIDALNNMGI